MKVWEERIVAAFVEHYFASAPKTGVENRAVLRLRHALIFPDFDAAQPDEKEFYLEAAEALEQKGLVKITWEKHSKGERVKTISCADFEKLFTQAGGAYPQAEAEKIRALFKDRAEKLRDAMTRCSAHNGMAHNADAIRALLEYFSVHFAPREIARGIDYAAAGDFIRLLDTLLDPAQSEKITTRALSIVLYSDSKRLENILALFKPLLSRAQKENVPAPPLSFLERSYPDTLISGNIVFEYKAGDTPPLINAEGLIVGLPLESVAAIGGIKPIAAHERPSALIIENKETFYALGSPHTFGAALPYDCFLYAGGYLNQAVSTLIRLLAASDFRLYHAGDLDPDGILILQHICDTAARPVTPVMMNAAAFDRYLPWSRPLSSGALRQLKKIRGDTRALPGIAELIQRIEQTAHSVEQEIIDYRSALRPHL
ncbi:MAG: DUF2220 domain-containing protein [Spirochaetaceae bacterium]|jgi:hypothetical protein|nr:DUF2220 domain-containing protein [Spirochaetaceae bacterium]